MSDADLHYYPFTTRLPTAHAAYIGRITVRWATIEWQTKDIIYALLNISPKAGRYTVRDGNIETMLNVIQAVSKMRNFHPKKTNIPKLRSVLKELESYRNKLAHGTWHKEPKSRKYFLQETRGSYAVAPGSDQKINARIKPRPVAVSTKNFHAIIKGMDNCIKQLRALKKELASRIRASQKKQRKQQASGR